MTISDPTTRVVTLELTRGVLPRVAQRLRLVLQEALSMAYSDVEIHVFIDSGARQPRLWGRGQFHPEDWQFLIELVGQAFQLHPAKLLAEPVERVARWLVPDWCGALDRGRFQLMPVCMIGVE